MRIRGERECRACGTRWSYYETGSVDCPDCGRRRSVGVEDERRLHTAGNAALDLDDARSLAAEGTRDEAAREAARAARRFVRRRGFVHAGDLRELDEEFLLVHELRTVAETVAQRFDVSEGAERYFLSLLNRAPDGDRPPSDEVPDELRTARGLAAATAVESYVREIRDWAETADPPDCVPTLLDRLRTHVRRTDALDGDVPPADADRLIAAARAIGAAARGEDGAADRARAALDDLD